MRDRNDPSYAALAKPIAVREPFTIALLYGDHEAGQRVVSRFGVLAVEGSDDRGWWSVVNRHWSLDRPDPR